jgi:hypothetical protein
MKQKRDKREKVNKIKNLFFGNIYKIDRPLLNQSRKNARVGTVVHACDPSYQGGGDQGGLWFEASMSKSKQCMTECACNPSSAGGRGKRTLVPGWPRQKCDTLSEK